MATLPPLIITAKDPMVYPERQPGVTPKPQTPQQKKESIEKIIQEICDVRDAGAAISHHHGVDAYGPDGQRSIDIEASAATILGAQRKSDVIIQMGGGIGGAARNKEGQQILEQLWAKAKWEMASCVVNQMEFTNMGIGRVTARDELEQAIRWSRERGVLPEFEVWDFGGTWNLRHILPKIGFNPPWWVELLHAAEGAAWSPAIPEETLSRAACLPEGCLWHVTAYSAPRGLVTPEEHTRFLTQIIVLPGNSGVGIGKEDRANMATGQPAKTNAEMVEHIAWIARKLGREVATPDQARQMLGLKRK